MQPGNGKYVAFLVITERTTLEREDRQKILTHHTQHIMPHTTHLRLFPGRTHKSDELPRPSAVAAGHHSGSGFRVGPPGVVYATGCEKDTQTVLLYVTETGRCRGLP